MEQSLHRRRASVKKLDLIVIERQLHIVSSAGKFFLSVLFYMANRMLKYILVKGWTKFQCPIVASFQMGCNLLERFLRFLTFHGFCENLLDRIEKQK